jgi:hypothetical protein
MHVRVQHARGVEWEGGVGDLAVTREACCVYSSILAQLVQSVLHGSLLVPAPSRWSHSCLQEGGLL